MIDIAEIRRGLAALQSDHDASGQHRPTVQEIFAPEQHANALDPNTPIVVGSRGAGKSFWAGVLEQDETRAVATAAYPHLGLDRLIVRAGYTGFSSDSDITPKMINARVPAGTEDETAFDFWQAVVLRAAESAVTGNGDLESIRAYMERYADPEDALEQLKLLDGKLVNANKTVLVTFDALDTISKEWKRSGLLIDALFEVIWSLRARRCIRAKVFIRPEQLNDDSLRFVELPKLRSGRVELEWTQVELYGLLFWRLADRNDAKCSDAFRKFATSIGSPAPLNLLRDRKKWALLRTSAVQKEAMENLAGKYMGRGNKKGGTYDWPYKHLADAKGTVTPRSFIKLFSEAARYGQTGGEVVISAEGIRHGLREASKVRVDQLGVEYKWVKRALAPLAGLTVPCSPSAIYERWSETNTVRTILAASTESEAGFLPPFPPRSKGDHMELLTASMEKIGLFSFRSDGRIDIPDLFRVAALMLKKGGTTPTASR